MFDLAAAIYRRGPVALAVLILGAQFVSTPAMAQSDFETRLAEAAAEGIPALLKIEADWCVDCRAFDKDIKDLPEFARKVDSSVLVISIDAEKGRGIRLAESYRVDRYPTFVLTDAEGRTMDRWYGYRTPEHFMKRLTTALVDPISVERRRNRFAATPNEDDAFKLGEIATMEGYYGEAIAYYRQAGRLGGHGTSYYSWTVLQAMISGSYKGVFDLKQVVDEAEPILASAETEDYARLRISSGIARLAQHLGATDVAREFVKRAVEESKESDDPRVSKMRGRLLPDYSLLVEGNPESAIRYMEESLPSDWRNNAYELNNVAWWCFQNQEHLKDDHLAEAERLARRAVELSPTGNERANALDTLAELCNLRDGCGEALELIQEAIAEDPQNEYFQQQATRFEELLAAQKQD